MSITVNIGIHDKRPSDAAPPPPAPEQPKAEDAPVPTHAEEPEEPAKGA